MERVLVVGGGFGGLEAVKALRRADVEVTLVDRQNFHLFQPLAYQVATGALSRRRDRGAAAPRSSSASANVRVAARRGRPASTSTRARCCSRLPTARRREPLAYDTLIVAGGSQLLVLRPRRVARAAPELKSLESALRSAAGILRAFEAAEIEPDPERATRWLTFVVVGAGPTGVEMAGQIGELARDTLRRDFRSIDPRDGARPPRRGGRPGAHDLPAVPLATRRALARAARRDADARDARSSASTPTASTIRPPTARRRRRRDTHGDLGRGRHRLAARPRCSREPRARDVDRAGPPARRARPDARRAIPRSSRSATWSRAVADGQRAAPGRRARRDAAGPLRRPARSRPAGAAAAPPFRYHDKGNLATIGRASAVADISGVQLSGFPAWVALACRSHLLPDRLPEPPARADPLDVQLLHARPGRPPDPPLTTSATSSSVSACALGTPKLVDVTTTTSSCSGNTCTRLPPYPLM